MSETIEGLAHLNEQLKALKGIKTAKSLMAGLMVLQKKSQELAPVRTGYLRSSPETHAVGDNGAETVWNTDYSYYVETGTEFMEGRHYVGRALDENQDAIIEAVANQIEKDLEAKIK